MRSGKLCFKDRRYQMTHLAFLALDLALSHVLDAFNVSLPRFSDIRGGGVLEGVLTSDPEELVESAEEEEEVE
jgi:hypothetical protein